MKGDWGRIWKKAMVAAPAFARRDYFILRLFNDTVSM